MEDQFELTKKQSRLLLDLVKPKRTDIFYDLGCGKGKVVCEAVNYGRVGLSVGIETELEYYEYARKHAINHFDKQDLKKIDFWLGRFDNDDTVEGEYVFDLKEATIVYYSLEEEKNDLVFFKKRLNWNKLKIVKKDLPLVGFNSVANRSDKNCWFFMMKSPFKRIRNIKQWVESVNPNFNSIEDVYDYYYQQLETRFKKLGWTKKDAKQDAHKSVKDLKKLIKMRF